MWDVIVLTPDHCLFIDFIHVYGCKLGKQSVCVVVVISEWQFEAREN